MPTKSCEPGPPRNVRGEALTVKPAVQQKPAKVKACKGAGGKKLGSALEGKETYEYFDMEGVRRIIVPSKKPNFYPLTITQTELKRLQDEAVVLTEKERLKLIEDAKKEKARLEEESTARKKLLQQFAQKGGAGMPPRLSALEREARDKANYLLKRAWELKKEEDDEVKKANSLILQTKCQAIRDAQIIEHRLIQRELREEEKRIEKIMEDERTKAFMHEKQKMEEERAQKQRYVMELNQQMEEIEAKRLLDAEMMIEEQKKANEAMYQMMMDEFSKLHEQEENKKKAREALNEANEQLRRAKEIEREEERIADLKMQEYMRMRIEREKKLEEEKVEEKKKKDLEMARLRAQQEAASDLQAIQEEMAAVRRQEEYEREWRRKEREEARKRQRREEDTRLGREQQIRDIHRFQAMEIAREKREYEKNLAVQLELQEKERLLEVKRKHDAELYREEILKQINQKEQERIEERQEKYSEGLAIKAEEAKRKAETRIIVEKKVESLRQNRVPEGYILEIKRRLNI